LKYTKPTIGKGFLFSLFALIALHAFFFIYAVNHNTIYLADDSREYLWQAFNLKHHFLWYGGDFQKPYDAYLQTRRAPLYGVFIFLVKSIYNSDLFVCLIQNVMSIFSLLMVGLMANKLKIKFDWMLIPVLLFFFPTQLIYANRIMADVLFQFVIMLSLWYFLIFIEKRKSQHLYYFSLFIGLAMLTKPVIYLFSVMLIFFFIYMWRKKQIVLSQIFISFIPMAFVLLLSIYNQKQTNYFHFSSGNNMMVYHYYSTAARFNPDGNDFIKSDSIYDVARTTSNDLKEFSSSMRSEFIKIVKENPVKVSLLQLNGMLQFFIDHGRWDMESFFVSSVYMQTKGWQYEWQNNGLSGLWKYLKSIGIIKTIYLLSIIIVNILLAFTFFKFLLTKDVSFWVRVFLISLTIYIVLVTGFVGCSRYRMVLYPFIVLGVMHYFSRRKINIMQG
jgi:Dolichyl-phosphate-mannose-protein mannosyltransferase